jgi:serine protease
MKFLKPALFLGGASLLTVSMALAVDVPGNNLGLSKSGVSAASAVIVNEGPLNRLIIVMKDDAKSKFQAQTRVQYRDENAKASVQALDATALHTANGAPVELTYRNTVQANTHAVSTSVGMTRAELKTVMAALARNPQIASVEVDEKAYPQLTPNDTNFAADMWGLKPPGTVVGGANFVFAWDRKIGANTPVKGTGVVVAVLDTGYRPHADLAANVLPGYDFVDVDPPLPVLPGGPLTTANDGDGRDADATDPGDWNTNADNGCAVKNSSWHGTHVAGTIAAVGNNNAGVIGGAFGARILPVRVLGVCGGYTSDIVSGMNWAAGLLDIGGVTNPNIAKVINMSLGVADPGACSAVSPVYQAAVTGVVGAGTTVVVATGNDSDSSIRAPANCAGVIAVTAHTQSGDNASFANIGTGTSISAPGVGIFSTMNTGTTGPVSDSIRSYQGTSMATPHVAAAAALLLQVKPTLTPAEIKTYLTNNARAFPPGTNCSTTVTTCGSGMLDAFAAVRALQIAGGGAVNTSPSMTSPSTRTGVTGSVLQFTVTAEDADGTTPTFRARGLPSGATFNTTTGVFEWVAPVVGTYTLTFTPHDATSSGVSQSVTLSVSVPPPAAATGGGGGGGGSVQWLELLALAGLGIFVSLAARKSRRTR